MKIAQIALLVSDFEDGGVERNFTSLAAGLAALGVEVHFLVGNPDHPYLQELGQGRAHHPGGGRSHPAAADLSAPAATAAPPDRQTLRRFRGPGGQTPPGAGDPPGRRRGHSPVRTLRGPSLELPQDLRETRQIRRAYGQFDGLTALTATVARDLRDYFRIRGVPIAVLH
jgi:hypothetical protein